MDSNTMLNEILYRIAKGCEVSFRELYDMRYNKVDRFVSYYVSNKEDKEELISDVFAIVWKKREFLVNIANLDAWLFIISRNEAFRYLRKKRQEPWKLSIDEVPLDFSNNQERVAEVDDALLEEEIVGVFREALSKLPERCRLVFLLVRIEGKKHKEVAKILSITEGTVEQQMNIAIGKMTNLISKYIHIGNTPPLVLINIKNRTFLIGRRGS